MPRLLRLFYSLLFAAGLSGFINGTQAAETAPASWWDKLQVRDLDGKVVSLSARWVVVVFISPECPVANTGIPVLNALASEFTPRGFQFVGAYSDPTLELLTLRKHAAEYRLGFVAADDRQQRLAQATHASYTPEVFVFNREGGLQYRGRIDDRVEGFGAARPAATCEDLREVLTALSQGRVSPFETRPGFGCAIPELVRP